MKKSSFFLLVVVIMMSCATDRQPEPLWVSETYALYPDRIVQAPYSAIARSSHELVSDYKSLANEFQRARIDFKFSINGKDNEQASGVDHHLVCPDGKCDSPVITFGKQYNDTTSLPDNTFLAPDTKLFIRLNMRPVFEQFNLQGYYQTYNGTRLYRDDFKGVFVAGGTAPMTWDFDNLGTHENLELHDQDGDHIYELELTLNTTSEKKMLSSQWSLSRDISMFPQYQSSNPLVDALYNLSVEEMIKAIEPDSTFRTGKEWSGVWTRDISYSIILAMASQQPEVSRHSLLRKVKNDRIVQDTGTGGAYPVSTDRIVWTLAAWELYKTTGDMAWFDQAYRIIKNSMADDLVNIYDKTTGLVRGESSFLDWREQTYPEWMQPADIFESECLGTNAVHYQANMILAAMARIKNDIPLATKHEGIAERIKQGINDYLWMEDKGYYAQFLYGRNFKIVSPRSEALGEALCILFDIADAERKEKIIKSTPVNAYGIPCIHPQIPNIPPYHNNGIWPFVQTYWTLACARTGNESAVAAGLSAIYRPAALFLTSKENFVASTGDYAGTQINSDNMLWSLSGQLATVYNILFGISYESSGLHFKPCVPKTFGTGHRLKNFKYREAVLDIELIGYGHAIKLLELDGKEISGALISAELSGNHTVRIVLDDQESPNTFHETAFRTSLPTPNVHLNRNELSWSSIAGAISYKVIGNGKVLHTGNGTSTVIPKESFGEYQVIAIDGSGFESFASEPVFVSPGGVQTVEAEDHSRPEAVSYKGYTGRGYVRTSMRVGSMTFPVTVSRDGVYAVDFRYSNGHGPVNTANKCAVRSLKVNGSEAGTIVLPQRGLNEWSEWGFTNSVQVSLKSGTNTVSLVYDPANANMNGDINEAMIDHVRIVRID